MKKKIEETKTVLKMPLYNPDDKTIEESPKLKEIKNVVPLKFKNNKTGNIRAFTNAAEDESLKGKPLYLDMSKMITVFADDRNLTIIHNGTIGWSVAENIDEVVNVWKNVNNN